MTFLILFFLQMFFAFGKSDGSDLPFDVVFCKAQDPNLNQCIKEVGQKLLPLVADGIKVWNIPPIDPMFRSSATFTETKGSGNLTIEYTNFTQEGFSSTIIENVDADLNHGVMTFKLKNPRFYFGGNYKAKGNLFDFKVEGDGKCNITMLNGYTSLVIKFHVYNDHIKFNSIIVGFSFDDIYLDFTNILVNEDEELSKSASTFLNQNAAEIINGFKPQMEEFCGKLLGEFLQNIFDNLPYSMLFRK